MKHRVASQASQYRVAIPIFDRLAHLYRERGDEEAARAMRRPRTDCSHWTDAMLNAAHAPGMNHGGLPSMSDLNRLRHAANMATYAVGTWDGPWLETYVASLPPDLARVVESMFTTGHASANRQAAAPPPTPQAPAPSPTPVAATAGRPTANRDFNGWHLLAAVLAFGTGGDLLGTDYSVSRLGSFGSTLTTDCGNGWSVLTGDGSCRDEHSGKVLLRLLVGGGLTFTAYRKAEQVEDERHRGE